MNYMSDPHMTLLNNVSMVTYVTPLCLNFNGLLSLDRSLPIPLSLELIHVLVLEY